MCILAFLDPSNLCVFRLVMNPLGCGEVENCPEKSRSTQALSGSTLSPAGIGYLAVSPWPFGVLVHVLRKRRTWGGPRAW